MDEARFGTHSKIGHGWFEKGTRSRVRVKLGFKNFYVYSAIEPQTGESFSLLLPKVNGDMMSLFLKEFRMFCGSDPVVLVMDGAEWHKSKALARPEGIEFVVLPPYSPELNPVERFWLQLKRDTIRNKVYTSLADLEQAVCFCLSTFSPSAIAQTCAINWFN